MEAVIVFEQIQSVKTFGGGSQQFVKGFEVINCR